MEASNIKEMTVEEILESIEEQDALLAKLCMTHAVSPLENPHQIKAAKKNIARLKTEVRSRELAAKA